MIKGAHIDLKLNQNQILKDVSFNIPQGKITAFIGPSGAGKTTLIKCIANLYSTYSGTLLCLDKPIKNFSPKERALAIGYIFQQFNLFPHMTVLENCWLPLKQLYDMPAEQAQEEALVYLTSLGIDTFKNSYPSKLSGGQQQRVAIARALCLKPKLLLLDEPSSALDPQSTLVIAQLLKTLSNNGITLALSSHDMTLVNAIADYTYYVENGSIKAM